MGFVAAEATAGVEGGRREESVGHETPAHLPCTQKCMCQRRLRGFEPEVGRPTRTHGLGRVGAGRGRLDMNRRAPSVAQDGQHEDPESATEPGVHRTCARLHVGGEGGEVMREASVAGHERVGVRSGGATGAAALREGPRPISAKLGLAGGAHAGTMSTRQQAAAREWGGRGRQPPALAPGAAAAARPPIRRPAHSRWLLASLRHGRRN